MKLFDVGTTRVSFNPLLAVPLAYYILNDGLSVVAMLFLTLSLHELSHTVMASMLCYKTESIELHPFGFEARLAGELKSTWDELAIASAGPLFSIITGLCCMALQKEAGFVFDFAQASLALGVLNLIPAYPLDGGRMLLSFLTLGFDAVKAKRISVLLGFAVSALLLAGAVLVRPFNPSLAVFGIFICIADIKELKRLKTIKISSMLRSRTTLRKGESLPVRCIALHKNVTYSEAMRYIGTNIYTVIIVLDDDMNELDCISQNRLIEEASKLRGRMNSKCIYE
ncbi:MAG: M50 family metallopeptidase [Clostridia bacterium]|nr:M50 family metallopeptidase [Clostridia bacterium]